MFYGIIIHLYLLDKNIIMLRTFIRDTRNLKLLWVADWELVAVNGEEPYKITPL
jgi:hypothetical protein